MDDGHEQPAAQNYGERLQSGETHGPAGELQCLHGPGETSCHSQFSCCVHNETLKSHFYAKRTVMSLFSRLEF